MDVCDTKQLVSDAKARQTRGLSRWKGRVSELSTRANEGALGSTERSVRLARDANELPWLGHLPFIYVLYASRAQLPEKRASIHTIAPGTRRTATQKCTLPCFKTVTRNGSSHAYAEDEITSDRHLHWFHSFSTSNSRPQKNCLAEFLS